MKAAVKDALQIVGGLAAVLLVITCMVLGALIAGVAVALGVFK